MIGRIRTPIFPLPESRRTAATRRFAVCRPSQGQNNLASLRTLGERLSFGNRLGLGLTRKWLKKRVAMRLETT